MSDLPRITPADNGPLIVESAPRLTGAVALDVSGRPKVALCRGEQAVLRRLSPWRQMVR